MHKLDGLGIPQDLIDWREAAYNLNDHVMNCECCDEEAKSYAKESFQVATRLCEAYQRKAEFEAKYPADDNVPLGVAVHRSVN